MDAGVGEQGTIKARDLPRVVEGDKEVQEKLSKAKRRSVSFRSFRGVFSFFFSRRLVGCWALVGRGWVGVAFREKG